MQSQSDHPKESLAGDEVVRVVLQSSALDETEVPQRVLVAPWGAVRSSAGSPITKSLSGTFARNCQLRPLSSEENTAMCSGNGPARRSDR